MLREFILHRSFSLQSKWSLSEMRQTERRMSFLNVSGGGKSEGFRVVKLSERFDVTWWVIDSVRCIVLLGERIQVGFDESWAKFFWNEMGKSFMKLWKTLQTLQKKCQLLVKSCSTFFGLVPWIYLLENIMKLLIKLLQINEF
jgi:hypothetical protein